MIFDNLFENAFAIGPFTLSLTFFLWQTLGRALPMDFKLSTDRNDLKATL